MNRNVFLCHVNEMQSTVSKMLKFQWVECYDGRGRGSVLHAMNPKMGVCSLQTISRTCTHNNITITRNIQIPMKVTFGNLYTLKEN